MVQVAFAGDEAAEQSVRTVEFAGEHVLQVRGQDVDEQRVVPVVIGFDLKVAVDVGNIERAAAVFIVKGDLNGEVRGKILGVFLVEFFLQLGKFLFECHLTFLHFLWIQIDYENQLKTGFYSAVMTCASLRPEEAEERPALVMTVSAAFSTRFRTTLVQ